jgi:hypothetical protein
MPPDATRVDLCAFHFETMTWSKLPIAVEFIIASEVLGEVEFRKAYKATSNTKEFSNAEWVMKRCKENSLEETINTQQTIEDHTRKVV